MFKILNCDKKFFIVILLFVLIYGYFIYKIHKSKDFNQWDFRTYYYAVKIYEKAKNPYILENLKEESSGKVEFKFIYPIYTLLFFKVFTLFEYNTAFDIYILIKYILIIFLFSLWCLYFFRKKICFFYCLYLFLHLKIQFLPILQQAMCLFLNNFLYGLLFIFLWRKDMDFLHFL